MPFTDKSNRYTRARPLQKAEPHPTIWVLIVSFGVSQWEHGLLKLQLEPIEPTESVFQSLLGGRPLGFPSGIEGTMAICRCPDGPANIDRFFAPDFDDFASLETVIFAGRESELSFDTTTASDLGTLSLQVLLKRFLPLDDPFHESLLYYFERRLPCSMDWRTNRVS